MRQFIRQMDKDGEVFIIREGNPPFHRILRARWYIGHNGVLNIDGDLEQSFVANRDFKDEDGKEISEGSVFILKEPTKISIKTSNFSIDMLSHPVYAKSNNDTIRYLDIVHIPTGKGLIKGVWYKIESKENLYIFLGNWELPVSNFPGAAIVGNVERGIDGTE